MKKLSFIADENLIKRARLIARSQGKTLNQAIREWLVDYTAGAGRAREFDALMARLRHVKAGRHLTRDEMNER